MVLFKPYRTPINKQDMYYSTVVPPYQWGDMYQDSPWMPETEDSTESYTYYILPYM